MCLILNRHVQKCLKLALICAEKGGSKMEMGTRARSRSILRTKTTLKHGLEQLMQEKPVQQITVKELTDLVNLNRGTFYLHYSDIYDLLEDLENEMFDTFQELIAQHTPEEMNGKPFPLLKDIFRFVGEHAVFCRTLLGKNVEYTFVNKLKELIREKCFLDWQMVYREIDPQYYELLYSYILSGCIGVIEYWLFGDMQQSADELAELTEGVILRGVQEFV